MRHLVSGRKLKRTSSHRKALLANLATELFRHKSIKTTEAKAKELRPYAESMITKAKNALLKERQGLLQEGQTIDVHSRRIVAKHIRVKEVLSELFDSIAPAVVERNGGYTRVIKTGIRLGDAARTAIIELVDFSAPQDGAAELKKKRKKTAPAQKSNIETKSMKPEIAAPIIPAAMVETVEPVEIENVSSPVVEVTETEEIENVSSPEVEVTETEETEIISSPVEITEEINEVVPVESETTETESTDNPADEDASKAAEEEKKD